MKKIIFLICLFILVNPLDVSAASTVVECDGISFDIVDDTFGLIITKRGENPFMKTYSYEGRAPYVRDVACYDDMYLFYGFTRGSDDNNYYDSFMFVLDQEGNVVYEEKIDYGGNEEITGAVWVDQILFTITRVDDLGDRANDIPPQFQHFVIKTYDSLFQPLDSIQVEEYIQKYDSNDSLLLLYYTNLGPVDLGFDTQLNEYTNTDYFDIQESYNGSMEVSFINRGYLNGESVENGIDITYPGVYRFSYNSQEYNFVVHPTIQGVAHLETYDHEVSIDISSGNSFLNGDIYIPGTPISKPGNYTLLIDGLNGYEKSIDFTIVPTVEGVINGHAYSDPFVITFDGEGYLNNSLVTSPLQIEEDGDYILRVNGEGGLSDTYEFTFTESQSTFTTQDIIQKIDVFLLVIAIIVGVILIKKK